MKRLEILNKIRSGGFGVVHKGGCQGAVLLPLTLLLVGVEPLPLALHRSYCCSLLLWVGGAEVDG